MFVWPFLHFGVFLFHFSMIMIIIFLNRKALLNYLCAGMITCFALWSLSLMFVQAPVSRETAIFWNNLGSIGWIEFIIFFLLISQNITEKKVTFKLVFLDIILLAFSCVLIIAQFKGLLNPLAPDFILGLGWYCIITTKWFFIFYCFYYVITGYSIYSLVKFSKRTDSNRKKEYCHGIAISTAATVICGTLTNIIPHLMGYSQSPDFTDIVTLIWSINLTVAMVRYKFLTINPSIAAENILNTMNDAVFLIDKTGKIVYSNESGSTITGYPREKIIKNKFTSIFPDVKWGELNNQQSDYRNLIIKYVKPDGTIISLSSSYQIFKDDAGDITGYIMTASNITDYQNVLDELEDEREYLKQFAENTNEAIQIIKENTVIFMNENFCKYFGVSRPELEKSHFLDVISPETRKQVLDRAEENRKNNIKPEYYDLWIEPKNSDRKYMRVHYANVFSKNNMHLEFLSFADMTELKMADDLLTKERDTAQKYLDITATMIIALDKECTLQLANQYACSVLQLGKRQIKGINWIEHFIPEQDKNSFKTFFNKLLCFDSTQCNYKENVVQTIKGELRTVAWRYIPLIDSSGSIKGVLASGEDISERKRLENELNRSVQLLKNISSSSPFGFYVVDHDADEILHYNRSFFEIWRMDAIKQKVEERSAKNTDVKIYIHSLLSEEHLSSEHQTVLHNKKSRVTSEEEIALKDGRTIRLFSTPIIDHNGIYLGTFYIFEDVTSEKNNHNELLRAKREAESASRAKSQFLATMSHEIKTPMNGIVAMSALLIDSGIPVQAQQYVSIIQNSADSLLLIINNILNYAKIEAGKTELECIEFNLRTLVEDVSISLAFQAYKKGLEINTMFETDVPEIVQGDPIHLRQVLINLLGNSIKFTEKGEIIIAVALEDLNDDYYIIKFDVTDTGIGIPLEMQGKLFSSFTQADNSITRKYGGTGLGLAICRELVRMMGGEIGLSSSEENGSKFRFTVKLKKTPQSKSTVHVNEKCYLKFKNKKSLVISNNQTTQLVLDKCLSQWGFRNNGILDVNDALLKIEASKKGNDPIKLILIDICKRIDNETKKFITDCIKDKYSEIILIVPIGVYISDKEVEKSINGVITKPLREKALLESIINYCKTHVEGTDIPAPLPLMYKGRTDHYAILVVDDNRTNLDVLGLILDRIGYVYDVAYDGEMAFKHVEKQDYNLILMDCHMPEKDGFEATSQIRKYLKDNNRPIVPVIAMTAEPYSAIEEKFIRAGMNDFLPKPITPKSISEIVNKWKQKKAGAKEERYNENVLRESNLSDHELKIINVITLHNRLGNSRSILNQLFDKFILENEKNIEELHSAIKTKNIEMVIFLAHKLKGSALNMCTERFAEIVSKLHSEVKQERVIETENLLEELLLRWKEVKMFINNYKNVSDKNVN